MAIALLMLAMSPLYPTAAGASAHTGTVNPATFPTPASFPITHIVYLMMENHAYDNYFGVYCQKISTFCSSIGNGIPAGTCVPENPALPNGTCIKPFALNKSYVTSSLGGTHNWASSHFSYDSGKMDGFYLASPNITQVFGYYNGSTIPTYWNLAEQFGLSDDFFSSVLDYSPTNHWYMLAGQSPAAAFLNYAPSSTVATPGPLTALKEQYLNESNATATLNDEAGLASVSWRYYDAGLNNVTYVQAVNDTVQGNKTQPGVFDYWDPLLGKAETYNATNEPHIVNRQTFAADAAAGALPDFSWVIPAVNQSDHPISSIASGMSFVNGIVNDIEGSPQWNSTALFVTWDEYGGYYDHVPPPQIDGNGLGFRVPLLVISPYTPIGYLSNQLGDFDSVTHLMEWKYGLSSFTHRDAAALLPMNFFDLNATPRAPDEIKTTTIYPSTLQKQALLPVSGVNATSIGSTINVSWSERKGTAPVAGYTIQWGPLKTKLKSVAVSRNVTSLSFPGITCNTTYTFQVRTTAGANVSQPILVKLSVGTCHGVRYAGVSPATSALQSQTSTSTDGRSSRSRDESARVLRRGRCVRARPRPAAPVR